MSPAERDAALAELQDMSAALRVIADQLSWPAASRAHLARHLLDALAPVVRDAGTEDDAREAS